MSLFTCKMLREFFRLFGRNNRLYKKYRAKYAKMDYNSIFLEKLKSIEDFQAYLFARIDFKQRLGIDLPAIAGTGNKFEYVHMKLKDIKREWDGKIYSLKQCSPYKYLETGDKKIYEKYIQKHIDANMASKDTAWNVKRFDDLFKSIKKYGYNPTKSVICVDENNIIIDGQHRACCLLYLHGGDYEVNVVKVTRVP